MMSEVFPVSIKVQAARDGTINGRSVWFSCYLPNLTEKKAARIPVPTLTIRSRIPKIQPFMIINDAVCVSSPNSLFPDSAPALIQTIRRRPGLTMGPSPSCAIIECSVQVHGPEEHSNQS